MGCLTGHWVEPVALHDDEVEELLEAEAGAVVLGLGAEVLTAAAGVGMHEVEHLGGCLIHPLRRESFPYVEA